MQILVVVFALALTSVLTSPVSAAENREAFAKRVGKYATIDPSKPKGMCWCKDGFGPTPGSGEVGYVVQENYGSVVSLTCMIPVFNGDGSFLEYYPCYVEWDMLGK